MKEFETRRFGAPIRLRLVDELDSFGAWDETTGEILIKRDQPKVGKYIVLLHELLHMSETLLKQGGIIKRRISHDFITHAAPLMLAFLVDGGIVTDVTPDEMTAFIEEMLAAEEAEESDQ